MSDEYKPLIVEGEKVGDYNDTTIGFDKWCMATVELWTSPKEFDAYHMIMRYFLSSINQRMMTISMLIVKMKSSHQE